MWEVAGHRYEAFLGCPVLLSFQRMSCSVWKGTDTTQTLVFDLLAEETKK